MRRTLLAFLLPTALLLPGLAAGQQPRVAAKVADDKIEIYAGGELAGVYVLRRKGCSRPIVWPILAPGGVKMTRDYPMGPPAPSGSKDHPHHQSVWFCHGDVIPVGMKLKHKIRGVEGVDFWSIRPGHGSIVCTEAKVAETGNYWITLDTRNEWRTADGQKVLDEHRLVKFYDFGNARLWIFEIELIARLWEILFGDTKEGSMAVRVNDQLREIAKGGLIQNADGRKGAAACWGQHSDWCDYSGTIDGKKVGIAIFDDPKNVSRAAWHARNYGLMAANPFGRAKSRFPAVKGRTDLVRLKKGETLRLRYGVLVHTGGTVDGRVAGYYQRFLRLGKK